MTVTLGKLEKWYGDRFGEFPLSRIAQYLVIGQVMAYVLVMTNPRFLEALTLRGTAVLSGEWWRLFGFIVQPVSLAPVWVVLDWYFLYIIGSSLEAVWGAFRYFSYLLIAYVATLAASFVFPAESFSNGFILGSSFLAFAYINPDFVVYLFFIIPVKIKWLAYIAWFFFSVTLLTGSVAARVQSLLAVLNFFLFFGSEIILHAGSRARHATFVAKAAKRTGKTFMRCAECGKTENDDKIFYTCRDCKPDRQFCEDHFPTHTHKVVH